MAYPNRSLGSDNHSGVHPRLLMAIAQVNHDHAPSYGTDKVTAQANKVFKQSFGKKAEPFFVFNGTAANVICLSSLVQSYNSVICSQESHLNMDECGAPEKQIGCKLHTIPTKDGKITPEQIEACMIRMGDQHHSQPKAVSITQPTELGTVYSLEEMKAIRETAHKHKLFLHIDGARLIYAAHYLKCSLKEITEGIGVDALSFGGTKNGLLFGEVVILFDKERAKSLKFLRKQYLQLPSKMRFLSSQFIEFLDGANENGALWKEVAHHGSEMASYLYSQTKEIPGVEVTQLPQANSVFARIPKSWIKALRKTFFFYIWDELTFEARWMISFDTTKEDIDSFVSELKKLSCENTLQPGEAQDEVRSH